MMDEETVEITEQEILDMEEHETIVWKGYLACVGEDSCVVQ